VHLRPPRLLGRAAEQAAAQASGRVDALAAAAAAAVVSVPHRVRPPRAAETARAAPAAVDEQAPAVDGAHILGEVRGVAQGAGVVRHGGGPGGRLGHRRRRRRRRLRRRRRRRAGAASRALVSGGAARRAAQRHRAVQRHAHAPQHRVRHGGQRCAGQGGPLAERLLQHAQQAQRRQHVARHDVHAAPDGQRVGQQLGHGGEGGGLRLVVQRPPEQAAGAVLQRAAQPAAGAEHAGARALAVLAGAHALERARRALAAARQAAALRGSAQQPAAARERVHRRQHQQGVDHLQRQHRAHDAQVRARAGLVGAAAHRLERRRPVARQHLREAVGECRELQGEEREEREDEGRHGGALARRVDDRAAQRHAQDRELQ